MGIKGRTFESGYATIKGGEDNGENYRKIAELMSKIGFSMNHSSARNYALRGLQKFAYAIASDMGQKLTENESLRIARDPRFQSFICEMMHYIEFERKTKRILK